MADKYFVSYSVYPTNSFGNSVVEWDGHDIDRLRAKVREDYNNRIYKCFRPDNDLSVAILNFQKLASIEPKTYSDGFITVKDFLEIVDYEKTFRNINVADCEGSDDDLPSKILIIDGAINNSLYNWNDFWMMSVYEFDGTTLFVDRGKKYEK